MSSNLKLAAQSLCKLKTTVSIYDHPELWLKENIKEVRSALGNMSGLRSLDLDPNNSLFPRIVAYIHVLSKSSGLPSTITLPPMEVQSNDQITRLSHYQSTQTHPFTCKENWETIRCLDNLSLLAHTVVVLKNYQDVKKFVEKRSSGIGPFLNLLQELLDAPYVGPARPLILRTLLHLTKKYGLYPESLILLDVVGNSSMVMASGSFGLVYQGIYRNKPIAIKVMRIISARDTDKLMKAFIREAILWRQFDHPNVVPFYGIHYWNDQQSRRICLVSPWMEHKNMIEYLATNSHADLLSLMLDVATGLQYLHKFDPTVIHGDLKGNNILITSDCRAAVADFGLCTLIKDANISFLPSSTSVPGAGAWKYMAPELLRPLVGKPMTTTATDVYAFGCICYEMFTGNPRFSDLTHFDVMMATVENHIVSRPQMCSIDLWAVIKACWEVNPSSRPNISIIMQELTLNLAKRRSVGSSNSSTSESLLSYTVYSQSVSSLLGSTCENHGTNMKGDEAIFVAECCQSPYTYSTTAEPNPSYNSVDPPLSGIQNRTIAGAGVRSKILPDDQTRTLRREDIIVQNGTIKGGGGVHLQTQEPKMLPDDDRTKTLRREDIEVSGIQDGVVTGAGVRLQTQKPKILPVDHTKTLRHENVIEVSRIQDEGAGVRLQMQEPNILPDDQTTILPNDGFVAVSVQNGIIQGAGVRLRMQELKILSGDQTKTLRSEDIIVAEKLVRQRSHGQNRC